MRLYGVVAAEIYNALASPAGGELDSEGNPRITGPALDGRMIVVVIAKEDPNFLITVFED